MVFRTESLKRAVSKNHCFENGGFETAVFGDPKEDHALKMALLKNASLRAKRKNMVFRLSPADVRLRKRCFLTGIEINYFAKKRAFDGPTLHLKEPTKGFVPGNVEVVSYRGGQSRVVSAARAGLKATKPPAPAPVPAPSEEEQVQSFKFLSDVLAIGKQALKEAWPQSRLEVHLLRAHHLRYGRK